jgi:hypothetical protein
MPNAISESILVLGSSGNGHECGEPLFWIKNGRNIRVGSSVMASFVLWETVVPVWRDNLWFLDRVSLCLVTRCDGNPVVSRAKRQRIILTSTL